jgi:hypothetical protein
MTPEPTPAMPPAAMGLTVSQLVSAIEKMRLTAAVLVRRDFVSFMVKQIRSQKPKSVNSAE